MKRIKFEIMSPIEEKVKVRLELRSALGFQSWQEMGYFWEFLKVKEEASVLGDFFNVAETCFFHADTQRGSGIADGVCV